VAGVLLLAGVVQAQAQAIQYDSYYALPGEVKTLGVDLGIETPDVSGIGDMTNTDLMAKCSHGNE